MINSTGFNLNKGIREKSRYGGIGIFFLTLAGLALVRIGLGFLAVPDRFVLPTNMVVGALFLGAPFISLFFAANAPWKPSLAIAFTVGGLAIQALFSVLAISIFHGHGLGAGVCLAVAQVGLPTWCVGLGALLATLVKEKNILIPIAIFLALYDASLVLTPWGPTRQIVENAPQVFTQVAASVPRISSKSAGGNVEPGVFAGPADFVFLAMFFVAIFRFEMRAKETLYVVVPALLFYMVAVLFLGIPLPALVPIGLAVLIVNWREFKMTRDEKLSTGLIAVLGIAILTWGAMQKRSAIEHFVPSGRQHPAQRGPVKPVLADPGLTSPSVPLPKAVAPSSEKLAKTPG